MATELSSRVIGRETGRTTTRPANLRHRRRRPAFWVAWFLLPGVALFVGLVLLPIVVAAILSFSSWTGTGPITIVGLANWREFFQDPAALAALERTGLVVLASWLVQEPIALSLGVFVAGRRLHRAALATIFFLPALFSSAALGILWSQLLSPVGGGVQYAGRHFGLGILNRDWLGNVHLVLGTVIVLVAWQFIPFHTLLYQAGAKQIPRSLYEAAEIDGITSVARVRYITVPMLRHTIVTSSTLNIVGSLTVFDLIYTLTGGGPGESTRVLALDQYLEGFSSNRFGYASALGLVLGVLGMVIAVVIVKVTGFGKMRSQAEGI